MLASSHARARSAAVRAVPAHALSSETHVRVFFRETLLTLPVQEAVECDEKEVRTMFYIGEFSKMGKTTVKTLHHYDRIGLLRPAAVDGATGYRLYTTSQLVDLHRIQALRQAGLSVDEVAAIEGGADPRPILARRRELIERELAARQERLARIAFMLSDEGKGVLHELPSHHQGPAQLHRVLQDHDRARLLRLQRGHPGYRPRREGGEPEPQVRRARSTASSPTSTASTRSATSPSSTARPWRSTAWSRTASCSRRRRPSPSRP